MTLDDEHDFCDHINCYILLVSYSSETSEKMTTVQILIQALDLFRLDSCNFLHNTLHHLLYIIVMRHSGQSQLFLLAHLANPKELIHIQYCAKSDCAL